jgi:predicted nucleic acid-binding protein
MNCFLPDVNALLALLDPMHVHHEAAHRWYASQSPLRIKLCSHVENGVIRVASQPKYPNCLGTGARVREALGNFARQVKAESCDKEVSLLDDGILLKPELLTPSRVTDLYLRHPPRDLRPADPRACHRRRRTSAGNHRNRTPIKRTLPQC